MYKVEEKYRPRTLDQIVVSNHELISSIKSSIQKQSLIKFLIIGPEDTCKSTLANIIINTYYSVKFPSVKIGEKWKYVYKLNFMKDINWTNDSNELITFCRNNVVFKKMIVIDNMECLTDVQQQYIKRIMDKYHDKINFVFVSNDIKMIKDFIQTRTDTISINPYQKQQIYNIMSRICTKEGIYLRKNIFNHHVLFNCNKTISYYLNIINKANLLKLKEINNDNMKFCCLKYRISKFNSILIT